jgi:hypothetical protein
MERSQVKATGRVARGKRLHFRSTSTALRSTRRRQLAVVKGPAMVGLMREGAIGRVSKFVENFLAMFQ